MPTLDDIARRAGVSGATVSNVLRQRGAASPATIARVREAARGLGYRPNLMARAPAERRSPTIAVFFTNIINPFYPQFALEAERAHFAGSLAAAHLLALGRSRVGVIAGTDHLELPGNVSHHARLAGLRESLARWAWPCHRIACRSTRIVSRADDWRPTGCSTPIHP